MTKALSEPTEDVITARRLTKRYGEGILAVTDLDLSVRRGEVYGFLGLNGAGKTTTLRMLLGLIRPTSGTAGVAQHPPGEAARRGRSGTPGGTTRLHPPPPPRG